MPATSALFYIFVLIRMMKLIRKSSLLTCIRMFTLKFAIVRTWKICLLKCKYTPDYHRDGHTFGQSIVLNGNLQFLTKPCARTKSLMDFQINKLVLLSLFKQNCTRLRFVLMIWLSLEDCAKRFDMKVQICHCITISF